MERQQYFHTLFLGTFRQIQDVRLILIAGRQGIRRIEILITRVIIQTQTYQVHTILFKDFETVIGLTARIIVLSSIILHIRKKRNIAALHEIEFSLTGTD